MDEWLDGWMRGVEWGGVGWTTGAPRLIGCGWWIDVRRVRDRASLPASARPNRLSCGGLETDAFLCVSCRGECEYDSLEVGSVDWKGAGGESRNGNGSGLARHTLIWKKANNKKNGLSLAAVAVHMRKTKKKSVCRSTLCVCICALPDTERKTFVCMMPKPVHLPTLPSPPT